jgi:hypothetical protein
MCIINLSVFSQSTVNVDLHNSSFITINGSSNIISFKLFQKGEDLTNKNFSFSATQDQNRIYIGQNQLSIPVRKFNSDNKMALHDFLKLIKSSDYPNLLVQLNYFESASGSDKTHFSKGNASVNITITGVTKQFNIPISSSQEGDVYSVDGKKNINIRDFGLTPPVEMMGLLKVSEWININFHLIGKVKIRQTLAEKL